MKRIGFLIGFIVLFFGQLVRSGGAVFTNDTTISAANTNFEGQGIVVSNCTLTVDGPHSFSDIQLGASGVLTHTFYPGGTFNLTLAVTNEPHVLTGTNFVVLSVTNAILATVVVTDSFGTVQFINNIDYVLTQLGDGTILLQRTTASSAIPDGGTVLVSYQYSTSILLQSGLNLTVSGNMVLLPGSTINAGGRGYGGNLGPGNGGEAGGPLSGGGGAYGGYGGLSTSNAPGGTPYGLFAQPSALGSGGGSSYAGPGGAGGGSIRLIVGGSLVIDGQVSANGANGTNSRSGGGAGGGIWITAGAISGSGAILANGGGGEPIHGGGGGGGRIALEYGVKSFLGLLKAVGGPGAGFGGAGTIYTTVTNNPGELLIDNGGIAGANTPLQVTNSAAVTIRGKAVALPNITEILGALTVKADGLVVMPAYPAVSFPLTVSGNATIESGGAIVADRMGNPPNTGPTAGRAIFTGTTNYGGGGGHGGYGGAGGNLSSQGGTSDDSIVLPVLSGGGGGGQANFQTNLAGVGGGAIRLTVNGTLTLDGRLSADGGNAQPNGGGGGGGGSIYINAGNLLGQGTISANGGAGNSGTSGGGAGGRIAIDYIANFFSGTLSATGGGGLNRGGAGTIYTKKANQPFGLVLLDNGGFVGTNTPISISGLDITVKNGANLGVQNLQAHNLVVQSNGWVVPLAPALFATLTISGDTTIEPGGNISGDGWGYVPGQGPGLGLNQLVSNIYYGGGGGHGGYGASGGHTSDRGGITYGTVVGPTTPGSGGGGGGGSGTTGGPFGGAGGGAVRLNVTGALTINGRLSANGSPGSGPNAGGGAGGSLWLTAGSLSGAGIISANGGAGTFGGGGGGGRIAINFNTNRFTGQLMAYGGGGTNQGGAGTVYIKTNSLNNGQLLISNGGKVGTNTTVSSISGDLAVADGAVAVVPTSMTFANVLVLPGGNLVVTQLLNVTGNATIQAGGTLNANGYGSAGGLGNGAGLVSIGGIRGGGGHGGFGAGNFPNGGIPYGSIVSPTSNGSGGANGSGTFAAPFGGTGGGVLRMTVAGTLQVNGILSANGLDGDLNSGGGSGGSVALSLGTLAGTGVISANGGNGNGLGSGGSGGRISVGYNTNLFNGIISSAGGGGTARGAAGTIYLKANSATAGTVLVDNGGFAGTNTPLGTTYFLPVAPFNLVVSGSASVYAQTPLPLLSNLTVGANGVFLSLPGQSNLVFDVLKDLTIASNGMMVFDGKGYAHGVGPGAGGSISAKGAGGGYGGNGGASASGAIGGTNYGSALKPVDNGSGGGAGGSTYFGGGGGGGSVRLSVGGKLAINGIISCNGDPGLQDDAGGGSGGSIWINAAQMTAGGNLLAQGGDGDLFGGGGGGGGRIAVYSPQNTFTGAVSVAAGGGAAPGQVGTFYISSALIPFAVAAHSPSTQQTNTVDHLDLTFNEAVNPYSLSVSDFNVVTPSGVIQQADMTLSTLSPSAVRITFPNQNQLGNYRVEVGPNIADIFGQPMSLVYTGAFSISLPAITGVITDTNGLPVAGVTVQPDGGLQPAATDGSGAYALGVPFGWNGTVTPLLTGSMFAPGARSYTNVTASATNQNYVAVTTIAPFVQVSGNSGNLQLGWYGIAGVNYQGFWSTNLIDWYVVGPAVPGTNGLVQVVAPIGPEPNKFFKVSAQN